jgi:hypothetical protein
MHRTTVALIVQRFMQIGSILVYGALSGVQHILCVLYYRLAHYSSLLPGVRSILHAAARGRLRQWRAIATRSTAPVLRCASAREVLAV